LYITGGSCSRRLLELFPIPSGNVLERLPDPFWIGLETFWKASGNVLEAFQTAFFGAGFGPEGGFKAAKGGGVG
jgi:hypothetical protein